LRLHIVENRAKERRERYVTDDADRHADQCDEQPPTRIARSSLEEDAPSTARMPISRRRSATEYASTPYIPTAARMTATVEKRAHQRRLRAAAMKQRR
jgi:hypothetical protein